MDNNLHVTLIANAGVLIQYKGTTLLLDGIFGEKGHSFSNLKPEIWGRMLQGKAPFEKIDYLLFSHAHTDHFSAEMVKEFLLQRKIKGIFLPEHCGKNENGLPVFLKERKIPTVFLSEQTDYAIYQVESGISICGFSARHLDKQYVNVRHFCYLLRFGDKNILFTADVDYTTETFDRIRDISLRAVFVNPLFFSALRRGRFFRGEFKTCTICIYHVPFSEDDVMQLRPELANDLLAWPPRKTETVVLCDALQHIDL